jgi:hypothetical protein
MLAAASPYVMGFLIKVDPMTKATSYLYAWLWVACTALIGVAAASWLVDKRREAPALAAEKIRATA